MKFRIKLDTLTFLIIINSIIFLLALLVQTKGFDDNFFFLFGGEVTSRIFKGDLWILLTSNFFHLYLPHFLLNMYALIKIGELVEYYYGGKKLFVTYIIGGIGGALLTYLTSLPTFLALGLSYNSFSLGASGSIFALLGLLVGGTLKRRRYGADLPFKTSDLLIYIIPVILISFIPGLNINIWSHIGGLIAGVILGYIFDHTIGNVDTNFQKILTNISYYLSLILFFLSYVFIVVNVYIAFSS